MPASFSGCLSPRAHESSQAYSFRKFLTICFRIVLPDKVEEVPGPGAYGAAAAVGAGGPAFTIASRVKDVLSQPADTPGPGAYVNAPSTLGGPAFTIASKTPAVPGGAADVTPGPYLGHDSTLGGAAFTIGTRIAVPEKAADLPAPGDYHQEAAAAGGPAFTIAGRHAPPAAAEALPGPGEYYNPVAAAAALQGGPAFTMGVKPKRKKKSKEQAAATPAPGDYHAPLPVAGAAFTMGARPGGLVSVPQHGPAVMKALADAGLVGPPGPGEYDTELPFSGGPAFTIASRPAAPAARDLSPGPGQYADMKPFPRPLGDVVSSILKAPRDTGRVTKFVVKKRVSFGGDVSLGP